MHIIKKSRFLVVLLFFFIFSTISYAEECTDSDYGKNIFVKGIVNQNEDVCENEQVKEYSCSSYGDLETNYYDCPDKYFCQYGNCHPKATTQCTDSSCSIIDLRLDVVKDNCIDALDVALVAKCFFGEIIGECVNADVNEDGKIDYKDYRLVSDLYQRGLRSPKEETCNGWTCTEEECNEIDEDCDGRIDEDFDKDNEGYFDINYCGNITEYQEQDRLDCNDNDAAIYPDATEICNAIDDNCDDNIDEGFDKDGDGYFDINYCGDVKEYQEQDKLDCDDSNAAIHPGVADICNSIDDDCDAGTADGSGETAPDNSKQAGVCAGSKQSCTRGRWADDYSNVANYEDPEASCDSLDNDCDASVDEDWEDYAKRPLNENQNGVCSNSKKQCSDGAWVNWYHSSNIPDYESTEETCDNKDNNCDGSVDEVFDYDEDGRFDETSCKGVPGYKGRLDCNDKEPAAWTGHPEICDGIDNDCDGETDAINGKPLQIINPIVANIYSGHGCEECPAGSKLNCGVYGGWRAGTSSECEIPSGEDYISGTTWCYCHGNTPSCSPCTFSPEPGAGKRDWSFKTSRQTYKVCLKGEWYEKTCAAQEDCSNKIDNDCDGRLPEKDWDCVRRGWSKPGHGWSYWWDCDRLGRCSCDANAWDIPDFYYNPAEHSEWGMNPSDWRCFPSKIDYNDAMSMFVADSWSFEDMGKVWVANHAHHSLPWIIRVIVNAFYGDGIGEMERYADDLPEPSSWVYVWAIGTESCGDLDSVYSLKRDWTCFHNTFQTDKVFDWHDKDGVNWVSPVRNQGSCGSCWAHSTLGAVEAKHNIKNSNPDLDIDLSEQELVSCSDAGSCDGGSPSLAIDYVKDNGSRTEDCFLYQGRDISCSPSCDTKQYISEYQLIEQDPESMKLALREKGPLSVCMDWGDFMTWDGGIGKCNGQQDESGHCVTLVGYNDYDSYWIIKNSWGPWWYDNGYGKIGYGECRIDEPRYNGPLGLI